jgi:transposase-like protein
VTTRIRKPGPVDPPAKKPRAKRPGEGRPIGSFKLTEELKKNLIGAIRVGTPLKTALGYVGLSDEMIYVWRNRAEQAKKVKNPSKELQALISFFGEVDKALNEANVRAQASVHTLFTRPITEETSPEQQRVILQAAQFHLTHRLSKDYSTRVTTEVTGEDGGPVQVSGRMAIDLLRDLVANDVADE